MDMISCYRALALLTVLVLAVSARELLELRSSYDIEQFFPTGDERLRTHQEIVERYRLHRNSPLLYLIELPAPMSWASPAQVERLSSLTAGLRAAEGIARVMAITEIEGATFGADDLLIGPLFARLPEAHWPQALRESPLHSPLLVSGDLRTALVAVELKGAERDHVVAGDALARREIERAFPEATLASTGTPLVQQRLSDLIQRELLSFLGGVLGIFALFILLVFRRPSPLFAALALLVATNVLAHAALAALAIPMNAILITLPVILSVSCVSLLIHSLHLWASRRGTGAPFEERLRAALGTLRELWLPNLLGILTTAIGFMALVPSATPIISHYGVTVGLVLLALSGVAQLFLFLLLPWVDPTLRSWWERFPRWALYSQRYPVPIILGALLLLVLGPAALKRLNFSARFFDDLPQTEAVARSMAVIDRDFGGTVPLEIELRSEAPGHWKRPEVLQALWQLALELRGIPGVGSVITTADFFPDGVPYEAGLVAETLFLFSMAEKNPLLSFQTEASDAVRIALGLRDLPGAELHRSTEEALGLIQRRFPEVSVSLGGLGSYGHGLNQDVSRRLVESFWQPLLLIFLFLIPLLGSVRWALLACVPNFLPPLALMLALAATQVPVKPAVALIFCIALGFAFNNTLYILNRFRILRATAAPQPLTATLLTEANPCLLEAVIMLCGFSVFLTSSFTMNQNFGGFMLVSIIVGFLSDLYLLPALLRLGFSRQFAPLRRPRMAAAWLAGVVVLLALPAFARTDGPAEILRRSQALLDARDDQAEVEMKIIEENGEAKLRTLTLQGLRHEGFSLLARIQNPADIKNTAFLGKVDTAGNEQQWIYLPSSGQVRRLVTGKTKAGLLGSEIGAEDLNSEVVKGSALKLLKTDAQFHWIELTPTAGTSEYTRVVTRIDRHDHLPKFTEYYVQDKLKKSVSYKDYRKVGPVFRAHSLVVQNHLNGRSTEVVLRNVQVNRGLASEDFSHSALKE